jgi:hypothetical protein
VASIIVTRPPPWGEVPAVGKAVFGWWPDRAVNRCGGRRTQARNERRKPLWPRGEVPAWREGRRILDQALIVRSTVYGIDFQNRELPTGGQPA